MADDVVMESPDRQIRLMDAVDESEGAEVGDYIEEQIENPDFGRIAAQAAKQVIVQRVREAERAQVVDQWKDRVGELVTGIVKRAERGNIFVDLGGNAEAFIPKDKGIPRDVLRAGDRVRGYLYDVRTEPRGPQLFISRAAPEFMIELFKLEVPEVGQGLVEIKACARDPGDRAKIAVLALRQPHRSDRRLHRHARFARAGGVERAQRRARRHRAVVGQSGAVRDQRDGAGGSAVDHRRRRKALDGPRRRRGQARAGDRPRRPERAPGQPPDRLAAQRDDAGPGVREVRSRAGRRQALFQEKLEVDEEIAGILVAEGFSTVEEIAYVPVGELLAVEGFDEDIVEELRARARDALLNDALAVEEEVDEHQPADDLLALEGMDDETAFALAGHGVRTVDDLGEFGADEVAEFGIEGIDEERAAALILAARAEEIARLEREG